MPTVIPQDGGVGAEIRGLQVQCGLDADDYAFVSHVLDAHSVVVLRGQDVSPAAQRAFAAGIGTLRPLVYGRYSVPGFPEVMRVSNIRHDGQDIGISDAGSLWHSDGAYLREPDLYSLLHGLQIPHRDGEPLGDTLFASACNAYDALDDETKERLVGLRGINSFAWHLEKKARQGTLRRAPLTPEQKASTPDVEHPVVRRHPRTGRPCLFVSEAHTCGIAGMPQAEAEALLQRLWAHIASPRFVYRHRWQPGDLVIWDNCAVQHLASFDYGDIPRLMHRTGTLGPVPVAHAGPAKEAT
jgi:taurine dioxygenase